MAYVDNAINSAVEAGATDAQVEILRKARETGVISFDDLQNAIQATFDCFDDAGIVYAQTIAGGELPSISYSFSAPPEGSPTADACIAVHSEYVEAVYAAQPKAVQLADEAFVTHRDQIVACMRSLGVGIAEDATPDEIKEAAHITREEAEQYASDPAQKFPVDCIYDAGITTW